MEGTESGAGRLDGLGGMSLPVVGDRGVAAEFGGEQVGALGGLGVVDNVGNRDEVGGPP